MADAQEEYQALAKRRAFYLALARVGEAKFAYGDGGELPVEQVIANELPVSDATLTRFDVRELLTELEVAADDIATKLGQFFVAKRKASDGKENATAEAAPRNKSTGRSRKPARRSSGAQKVSS